MSQSDRDIRIQAQILAALQSAGNGLAFREMSLLRVAGKTTANETLSRNLRRLIADRAVRVQQTRRTTTGPLLATYYAQEVNANGSREANPG